MNYHKNKIIFLREGTLTTSIAKMYLLKEMEEAGYEIELWRLNFLRKIHHNLPDEIEWNNYYSINSYVEFKDKICSYDPTHTLIVSSVSPVFFNRKIYKLLTIKHIPYFSLVIFGSAIENPNYSLRERIELAFSSNILPKIKPTIENWYMKYIYEKFYHINFKHHIVSCHNPREIAINSNDYNAYLSNRNFTSSIINEKYIVFIDVFYPLHPELPSVYHFHNPNKQPYLKSINHFFDFIEEKYKLPIVIALHPKSTYSEKDFNGRKTYKYQTDILVKYADYVLTHISTSTTLAVIYNKPTLFLYPQYMLDNTPKYVKKILWLAKSLGKKALNIDEIQNNDLEILPFDEKYRYFCIYNYMTTKENENKTNKEIIISILNDTFDKLNNGLPTPFVS